MASCRPMRWSRPACRATRRKPPDWAAESLAERREQAVALVAAAGYSADKPARLEVIYGADDNDRRLLTAIAAMVKPYGIEFVPIAEENQVVLSTHPRS
ncbi:MAG: hypothetical protein WDN69_21170 [Aliidongia sp.]